MLTSRLGSLHCTGQSFWAPSVRPTRARAVTTGRIGRDMIGIEGPMLRVKLLPAEALQAWSALAVMVPSAGETHAQRLEGTTTSKKQCFL